MVQSQLEQAKIELEQVQRRGDLSKASEIQYGKIPDLEKKLAALERAAGVHGRHASKRGWLLFQIRNLTVLSGAGLA